MLYFILFMTVMELFVILPLSQGHMYPLLLHSPKKLLKGPNWAFVP